MCFNYSLNTTSLSLEKRFNALANHLSLPVYHANGFKHPKMPVITSEQPDAIQLFEWGLIPADSKNDQFANKIKNSTLNARSESIFKKYSFKNSIFSKRCLIPASGYFEFKHEAKNIIPHYIFLPKIKLFTFAGIWDSYINENNERFNTFSIITKEANKFTAQIHNTKKRMPVILPPEYEKNWLRNDLSKSDIEEFFKFDISNMDAYTISRKITDRNYNSDTPEILNKIIYPGTQQKLNFG